MAKMDKTSGGTLDGAGDEEIRNLLVEGVEGIKYVTEADDLPDAENGVRTLDDTYNGYYFLDFVADTATLDPNGVPMVGFHGGAGGYIHTGGTVAFQTNGTPFQADNFYGHAPGAQLFDLHADSNTRFYVTDSAFFDPEGMYGDIADLGVIDGYKVQAFKSVNFENFVQGLTLTGSPDKTFFDTCPFRAVSGSNATIVTGDANYNVDILKFIGDYVKDIQSDTTIVDLSDSGLPSEYFKYLNVDHDPSVNFDNVFTGFSSKDVGVLVENSFPLRDYSITGEMHADDAQMPAAVTFPTSDTYTQIDVPTLFETVERTAKVTDGEIEYRAKKRSTIEIEISVSFFGANGEVYRFAVAHNGTVEPEHSISIEGRGTQTNISVSFSALHDMVQGDRIQAMVKNETGTSEANISEYTFKVTPA